MPHILCIESSYVYCSVAVRTESGIYYSESKELQNHAESITLLIDDCLKQAGLTISELDAIAISDGPGSYTGLRIGSSTAKGICFAASIPLLAISTLYSIAHAARKANPSYSGCFWPMIDARRMEVYQTVFDNALNRLLPVSNLIIGEMNYIPAQIQAGAMVCGDATFKLPELPGFLKADVKQHALHLIEPAESMYLKQEHTDLLAYEPFYLKEANITQSVKGA
jgi:tRNA threonylcarbamoyladenosine biosynthesis protein TsaB